MSETNRFTNTPASSEAGSKRLKRLAELRDVASLMVEGRGAAL